jgi:hypothetical protein
MGGGKLTYQWKRGDTANGTYTDILGATSGTYVLTAADLNKYIKLFVGAILTYGGQISAPLGPINEFPPLAGTVTIGPDAGVKNPETPRPGEYLIADTSSLGGGGRITYQWQRNPFRSKSDPTYEDYFFDHDTFVNIPGATGEAYRLGDNEYGSYVRVVVGREGYFGKITSERMLIYSSIQNPESSVITIPIEGTPALGNTLKLGNRDFVQAMMGGGKLTYQWKRCDWANGTYTDIPGATSSTYVLTAADRDKYIKLFVGAILTYGGQISAPLGPMIW